MKLKTSKPRNHVVLAMLKHGQNSAGSMKNKKRDSKMNSRLPKKIKHYNED